MNLWNLSSKEVVDVDSISVGWKIVRQSNGQQVSKQIPLTNLVP